jgi:transitional endoplasmic reticulum ATPase
MDASSKLAKSPGLRDEYADLTDLHLLRLACGHGGSGGGIAAYSAHLEAFISIFGRFRTLNLTAEEMTELMKLRLEEVEAAPPISIGALFDNVGLLGTRLGLGPVEQEILVFRVLVRTRSELQGLLQSTGALSASRLIRILSSALRRHPDEIETALDPDGPLVGSALIWVEQTLHPFLEKLPLAPGLPNALMRQQKSLEALISFAVKRSEPPILTIGDYPHLCDELTLLSRYLDAAMRKRLPGVNILLYGPPGVGKTQLARVIAMQIGAALYEVAGSGARGEAITPCQRHNAYRFNQRFFAGQGNTVILFDEAEDALRNLPVFHPLVGFEKRQGKAWINELLEGNPVPAFWIANSLAYIEKAVLRRFDYVIEARNPPRSVRHRILTKTLEGLPITEQWLNEHALEERLSPALVDRAARVLRTAGIDDADSMRQFRKIVEGAFLAQGERLPPRYPQPARYRLDFVNAGMDLEVLVKGLARRAKGKLLLYGPPGSGKTAFAHHLARELDRTLLLKRASDLVSMWLGETEKNIARMFQDAAADDAVLLLDEADSFLRDRQNAVRSWEVTEVNELLTQMECFEGLFLCATNFLETLDSAALRRFGLKIRFDYLGAEQSWRMFVETFVDMTGESRTPSDAARIKQELLQLRNLTPGDFTAARQRFEMLHQDPSVDDLLEALRDESRLKPGGSHRSIGFTQPG